MAQQIILVITPAFFAAIHYAILGRIIELFGSQFTIAHFKPRAITPIFVMLDLASLGIQGAGSGLAAVAEIDSKDAEPGGNIVVIGLCVQLAAYLCFNVLLITFFIKASRSPNTSKNIYWTTRFKCFLAAFFLASILVFCRSVFRTLEMILGWIGPVSTVEWYFYAFDCAPVLASVVLLNLCHPGFVLPANHKQAVAEARERRNANGEKKKPRPRSSFYGGDNDTDVTFESAEMKDVSVVSSGRNPHGGYPRTQPHFRTGSLATADADSLAGGNIVTEENRHATDFDGSFGWSHPQSPHGALHKQHHFNPNSDIHRKMEADGFEPVSAPRTPQTDKSGFSPYQHHLSPVKGNFAAASSSTLSPSLYSHGNKSAGSFISEDAPITPGLYSPSSAPDGPPPEVLVWRDDGEATLVQSASGSSWGHQQPQAQMPLSPSATSMYRSTYESSQADPFNDGMNSAQQQSQSASSSASPANRQSRASEYAYAM